MNVTQGQNGSLSLKVSAKIRVLGFLVLALLCSSCASRPPVLATVGGVYVRATGRVDPLVGLVLPTQPVGFWASATYDIHAGTYGSVSVGITVPLVPGSAPPPKRGVEKQQ